MPLKRRTDLHGVTRLTRWSCRSPDVRSKAILVSFHTNRIEVQDVRYFVRDASSMSLGAYGQKKNSLMPDERPYLDVFDTIPAPKLAAITWLTTPLEAEFAEPGLRIAIELPERLAHVVAGVV